jgi:hypothetical protein
MIQTVVLLVTVIAVGVFAQMNASVLHAPASMSIPGSDIPLSNLRILAAVGGIVMLLWLAGMADLALLRAHLRRRDALLLAKDQEILHIKSEAYEHQQPVLTEMRARLEKISMQVGAMLARLDSGASTKPARVMREEIRATAPEPSATERVGVTD